MASEVDFVEMPRKLYRNNRWHCNSKPFIQKITNMNPETKKTREPVPMEMHHVNYLHAGNGARYTPSRDTMGIHCTGDKFDYIVAWQVDNTEKVDVISH